MTEREVTHIRKDEEGNVTHLCHPGQAWSPVGQRQAMLDIAAEYHRYYVSVDGQKVDVTIGYGSSSYCLEVEVGVTAGDYLEKLPAYEYY